MPVVEKVTPEIEAMAGGPATELSRGGMRTKIEAARIATSAGTHMIIADGRVAHPIARVAEGLLNDWLPLPQPVRLMGLTLSALEGATAKGVIDLPEAGNEAGQMKLF